MKITVSTPASLKHQDEILELIRNTPIPGAVSYHYERPVGYQSFAATQGTHFDVWEATEGDELLGFTQITFDQIIWNGKMATVAYSGDTRVSTSARGKGISNHLIQSACNQTVPVFGAVMGSNKIVLEKKLNDWKKLGVNFREITEMKALLYKPAPLKIRSHDFICKIATDSDLPAMYFLWKQYSQTRNLCRFYPSFESFSAAYHQTAGISLHQTILVFAGVSLVAMITLWDQSKIRKLVVDHRSMMIKLASKFISLPKVGEELKILYGFQHAFQDSHPEIATALKILIKKARNVAHQENAHFLSLGLDANDPQLQSFSKSAMMSNSVRIILDSRKQEMFENTTLPLHLEVGMG